MACFRCNTTENFIFLLKYRQQKVDLKTSKKLLVFVTIQNFVFTSSYRIRKFHIYGKIRICGKMLLSYIFVWRKAQKIWYFRETETYENKRKYDLFCPFFSCSVKSQASSMQLYSKRDSGTGIFLWILPNFKGIFTEHFQVQVTASCNLFSAKYVVQSMCFETSHENICS